MNGRLVLIVGASGAGKDTLLSLARRRLHDRADVVFTRRVITRPPDNTEAHEPANEAEFAARRLAGGFALDWRAHGLHYGIAKSIETDLAAGRQVVANVSRGIIEESRARFPSFVIEIAASRDLLASRLQRRNRETEDEIATRLQREAVLVQPDAVIFNDGSIEEAGQLLVALIDSRSV